MDLGDQLLITYRDIPVDITHQQILYKPTFEC